MKILKQSLLKKNKHGNRLFGLLLLIAMLPGFFNYAAAQYSIYDIAPVNGNTQFAHNQAPETLVPVNPTSLGVSYQWQESLTPYGPFLSLTGRTTASFTFSVPIGQTMYYRRGTSLDLSGTNWVYSNVVKYEVVSVNHENINYVRTHDVLVPGITEWKVVDELPIGSKMQSTTYMDGLGRTLQKVSREVATPSSPGGVWGDAVKFAEYDGYGRQTKNYLPFTTDAKSGKFKTSTTNAQSLYYTSKYNETFPYSETTFESSPMNRATNVKSPGTSWHASLGNSSSYELNDETDQVRLFTIGYGNTDIPVSNNVYDVNMLMKIRNTDENGKLTIEYYDKRHQLVFAKTQLDNSPLSAHTGWICTYSVFDDFGRLRFRLQPEAVKYLEAHSWSLSGTDGADVLNGLCFKYEYDEKNRMISKKAPGAEPLYMIYDQRDRMVFMQDGNQRAKPTPEWTTVIYDELDRAVISLLYATTKSRTALQTDLDNAVDIITTTISNPGAPIVNLVIDHRVTTVPIYTAQNSIEFLPGFDSEVGDEFVAEINSGASSDPTVVTSVVYKSPISNTDLNNPAISTILKYSFYDSYTFSGARSFDNNFDNELAYPTGGEPIVQSSRILGMPTGSLTKVLGTSTFLSTTQYYDDKGRGIQQLEENIKSGVDITTAQYQFDGRVLSSNTKHSIGAGGSAGFSTVTKNNFDQIGRIISIEKKYGSNSFKTITAVSYDDMGLVKTKRLDPGYTGSGKNELESMDYSYNIQNQITGVNKDYALKTSGIYNKWGNFFGYYLGYDNRDNTFAAANLMGRVTGILWNTQGDDAQRKYDFSYDNVGRLINAAFNQRQAAGDSWSNAKLDFSVTGNAANGNKITYDLNGNLLNMLQRGIVPGNSTPVNVDDLSYTYTNFSNKLVKVIDNGTLSGNNGKLGDFSDGTNAANNDYVYDGNGNVVVDLNKDVKDLNGQPGIGIKYNHLDKPEEIRIAGKGVIKIVYDADAQKLQRSYTPEGSSIAITTTYINAFVYQGDELQYINFEEGRIRVVNTVNENNGYDYLTMDGNMDLPGNKRGAFDYYLRDYQGNVRMILTEQTHAGSNTATMEAARAANEEPIFGQVDENGAPTNDNEVKARFAVSSIPGQGSPGGGWTNNAIGSYVSRVGNPAGKKIGPNSLLKVMAGDEVSATSIYYYQNPVSNVSGTSHVSDVLTSLAQAISGGAATTGLTHGSSAATAITGDLNGYLPFTSIVSPDANSTTGNNPKAYLTVLFFDERFNFVPEGSTNLRVSQAGNDALPLVLANIKAPKNGYAYVYVSNESNEMVYFDNLQVTHVRKHIIEENHYYAYGLRIAGISSKKLPLTRDGHIQNGYLYNGKELFEEADLDWYDYGFRMYDPQIGRFTQLDPLTDRYPYLTPYQYASCDPITNIDIDGLEGGNAIQQFTNTVYNALFEVYRFSKAITLSNVIAKPKVGFFKKIWNGIKSADRWVGKHVIPRVFGALKVSVGFAIMVVGAGAAELGIGIPVMVFGADVAQSGWHQTIYGEPGETFTSQTLQYLGWNKEDADMTVDAATIVLGTPSAPKSSPSPLTNIKVVPKKTTAAALPVAVGLADDEINIALGVKEHLDNFAVGLKEAKGINASTWKTWGQEDFPRQFLEMINNPSVKIHFNLDVIRENGVWKAITDGIKAYGHGETVTNWELYRIYSNPGAMSRTTFYEKGVVVPNPFD